jgi:hypothetical protein
VDSAFNFSLSCFASFGFAFSMGAFPAVLSHILFSARVQIVGFAAFGAFLNVNNCGHGVVPQYSVISAKMIL